jgi:hypothetical protein
MKKESVFLSLVAIGIGIIVSGVAFYLYQSTKTIPSSKIKTVTLSKPTPTDESGVYLDLELPKDESVTDSKTITVAGKTDPTATIIVSTVNEDVVVQPTQIGTFSTTVTIGNDASRIDVMAVLPNGQESKVTRIVTYSTESF